MCNHTVTFFAEVKTSKVDKNNQNRNRNQDDIHRSRNMEPVCRGYNRSTERKDNNRPYFFLHLNINFCSKNEHPCYDKHAPEEYTQENHITRIQAITSFQTIREHYVRTLKVHHLIHTQGLIIPTKLVT